MAFLLIGCVNAIYCRGQAFKVNFHLAWISLCVGLLFFYVDFFLVYFVLRLVFSIGLHINSLLE